MKKILVTLLVVLSIVGLAGCGALSNNRKEITFTDQDLVFTGGGEETELEINHTIYIWPDVTDIERHSDYDYEEFESSFVTDKGLSIGDTVEDYKRLYIGKDSYAAWEIVDDENYTMFQEYTGQSAADIRGEGEATWLDAGYYFSQGEWKQLTALQIRDIWLCDANLEDYDEVVILSVYLDKDDVIGAISMNYFDYSDGFVDYQGWIE